MVKIPASAAIAAYILALSTITASSPVGGSAPSLEERFPEPGGNGGGHGGGGGSE